MVVLDTNIIIDHLCQKESVQYWKNSTRIISRKNLFATLNHKDFAGIRDLVIFPTTP